MLGGLALALLVLAPPGTPAPAIERLQARLERAREQIEAAHGAIAATDIEVRLAATTSDFVAGSGRGRREAAAAVGGRLHLQPLAVLARLEDLDAVLRHELSHLLVESRHRRCPRPTPRWLHEGLAGIVAMEDSSTALDSPAPLYGPDLDTQQVDRWLARPPDEAALRLAHQAARRATERAGGVALLRRCP